MNDTIYPTGLYTIDTSGSNRRIVIRGFAYNPDWSPDGRKIAFNSGEIFTINANGDSLFQVTSVGAAFFPNWSPDGGKISFDTQYQDPNGANAIWIINADGTGLKDISLHGTGEWRQPDWSPSGDRLVHVRFISIGTEEVFVMDTTGLNAVRLTFNEVSDRCPKWSPDGMSIAWTSGHDIDELWVMNSDGTNPRKITTGVKPAWSPDSRTLVYQKAYGDKKLLYIINLVNGVTRQLTPCLSQDREAGQRHEPRTRKLSVSATGGESRIVF